MTKNKRNTIIANSICLLVILILEYAFFRHVINIDALIGDNIDSRLNTIFVEHWYRFVQGKEAFNDMSGMFYPAENVLSYSDIMLGYGVLHILLRVLNVNVYLSLKILIILTHICGSILLYYFVKGCLKKSYISSTVAVIVFSFSSFYAFCSSNVQFFAFSVVPFVCIMCHKWFDKREQKKRFIYGALACMTIVMLFYTAFYVGFLSSLCLGIAFVVSVLYMLFTEKKDFLLLIKKYLVEFLVYIIGMAILMVPFIMIYLPSLQSSGGRLWEEVYWSLPNITEIVGIEEGIPSILFHRVVIIVILVLAVIYIVRCIRRKKSAKEINILIIASLILFMIFTRCGNYSLWYLFFRFVPGAGALRALFRAQIIVYLAYGILLAYLIDEVHVVFKYLGSVVLAGAVLISIYYSPVITTWSISEEMAYIGDVSSPPEDCKVLYVIDSKREENIDAEKHLDGVMLAQRFDLKTINGYSGLVPPNYNVSYADINKTVKEWCKNSGVDINSVYGYSFVNDSWEKLQ